MSGGGGGGGVAETWGPAAVQRRPRWTRRRCCRSSLRRSMLRCILATQLSVVSMQLHVVAAGAEDAASRDASGPTKKGFLRATPAPPPPPAAEEGEGEESGASSPDAKLLLLPPPPPPPSPEGMAAKPRLKIVTGGDAAMVAAADKAVANHRAYAKMHGYGYEIHTGNYAAPWVAYWHKIEVLLRELQAPDAPEVIVWVDLDIIFTNPTLRMFEDILSRHPSKDVILTEDAFRGDVVPGSDDIVGNIERPRRLVNTGVIIVRTKLPHSEKSSSQPVAAGDNLQQGCGAVRVLEKLFDYGRGFRDAAYQPQSADTLHEQDAFNQLLGGPRRHMWLRHVAVLPQRGSAGLNLNTFARSYYDARYKANRRQPVQWRNGDFTAHCTGLRWQQREWCIDDSVEAAQAALAKAQFLAIDANCGNGTLSAAESKACLYVNASSGETFVPFLV
eukprot:TRINITY_DN22598_c0_g1_i1.p1 TRINITY_DN22598_c0_g1~~TRINITY_DN22598_c0_g1_i1.p1  ORF type:complete len:445 (+),score=103.87 TRINITY_DN22598_c0_g1_i1:71-1405(+)